LNKLGSQYPVPGSSIEGSVPNPKEGVLISGLVEYFFLPLGVTKVVATEN
jgi:hypothetical protein